MTWLRAVYHAHTFHYRMPETAAISAVNPLVPSPLTVKMAMMAALLRQGRADDAERLSAALDTVEVRVRPPAGASVYRALLRYVRPPGKAGKRDGGTASLYGISPHYREFALWCGVLEVYAQVPGDLAEVSAWALERVPYLGAKDSLVSCEVCTPCDPDDVPSPRDAAVPVDTLPSPEELPTGVIVQLADVARPVELNSLLPGNRSKRDFRTAPYRLPGLLRGAGGVRQYVRDVEDAMATYLGG